MKWWENFEFNNQTWLAPLLANVHQKEFFSKSNHCHERMFFDLLTRIIRPTHFFEIGAHEASTSWRAAQRLPETICVAFEADPDIFDKFSNSFKKNPSQPINFSYVHSAISDIDGQTAWYKQAGDKNAFLPNNSLLMKNAVEEEKYINKAVEVHKLDTLFPDLQLTDRVVLRIDVEGLCYEALSGALNTLQNCVALYAEVEDYEIWKGQKTVFQIYELLEQTGLVPVSRDVQTPGQYNVFWLTKAAALMRPYRARLALYYEELGEIAQEAAKARKAEFVI